MHGDFPWQTTFHFRKFSHVLLPPRAHGLGLALRVISALGNIKQDASQTESAPTRLWGEGVTDRSGRPLLFHATPLPKCLETCPGDWPDALPVNRPVR
jgi:hypothetical protein